MQLRIKTTYYLKVKLQGQLVENNRAIESEIIPETALGPNKTGISMTERRVKNGRIIWESHDFGE